MQLPQIPISNQQSNFRERHLFTCSLIVKLVRIESVLYGTVKCAVDKFRLWSIETWSDPNLSRIYLFSAVKLVQSLCLLGHYGIRGKHLREPRCAGLTPGELSVDW